MQKEQQRLLFLRHRLNQNRQMNTPPNNNPRNENTPNGGFQDDNPPNDDLLNEYHTPTAVSPSSTRAPSKHLTQCPHCGTPQNEHPPDVPNPRETTISSPAPVNRFEQNPMRPPYEKTGHEAIWTPRLTRAAQYEYHTC
ncbi:hypothetical protein BS47DRAFT_1359093 [Hydnum rufescens UP504]|uniref:Uncharacterized protein n=1 Tax=Hydnum rufescens UP504 TaxID=1448309 RepID=A0A9P6DX20_9AGAM|nr:hypothetical protein BS47DRAFT_1359093 [Hydnum rufescens UP504]